MSELVASTNEGGDSTEVNALAASLEVSAEVSEGAVADLPEATNIGTTETNLKSGVMFNHERMGMSEEQWEKINPDVKRRLKLICHYGAIRRLRNEEMFQIQADSIPIMCMDKPKRFNLVAQAPGGAGKTVAFCIGLLSRIDTKQKYTQGLIIGMTRELARMIYHDALVPLGAFLGYDDEGNEQINPPLSAKLVLPDKAGLTRQDPYKEHVIVGTPGKLKSAMNLFNKATQKYGDDRPISVDKLRVLVLDEADEVCLGEGVSDDVRIIRSSVPTSCQIFLYSATYPENVIEFAKKFLSGPIARIELTDKTDLMIKNRRQFYMKDLLHKKVAKVSGIFKSKTFTVTKILEGELEMGNEIRVGSKLIRITKQDEGSQMYHTFACCNGHEQASIVTSKGGAGRGGRGGRGGRAGRGRGDSAAAETCVDCISAETTYDVVLGKVGLLREVYNCLDSNQSIVFCNTIDSVNAAQSLMESFGLETSVLHGRIEPYEARDRAMDNFRGFDLPPGKRSSKVLICTDVLARGVDIPNVNLVVNFDIPKTYDRQSQTHSPAMETYAHRIARCARAGRYGVVINFAQTDQDSNFIEEIAKHWCPSDTTPDKLIPQWVTFKDESGEEFEGDMDGFQKWFLKFQTN